VARFNESTDSNALNPGLHCLHQAGWVHRDFNPGNVIVVGGEAKISDLKFAKRRSANELKRLTRLGGVFSPGTTDNQTVGLSLASLWLELTNLARELHASWPLRSSISTTCSVQKKLARIQKCKTMTIGKLQTFTVKRVTNCRTRLRSTPTGSSFTIHFMTMNLSGGLSLGSSSAPDPRESPTMLWRKRRSCYTRTAP